MVSTMVTLWDIMIYAGTATAPFFLYWLKKYGYAEEMKRELSGIILSEIRHNSDFSIDNPALEREKIIAAFHTNVYDGIVHSTHIRYFDKDLQKKLHDLYHDIKDKDPNSNSNLEPVIQELLKMEYHHPGPAKKIKKTSYRILNIIFWTKHKNKYIKNPKLDSSLI